jgi:hypothetical protein
LRRHKAIGEQLKRKQFFFEKKNQKTFARCSPLRGAMGEFGGARNRQKFFVSFFQKRNTSFLARSGSGPIPAGGRRNRYAKFALLFFVS